MYACLGVFKNCVLYNIIEPTTENREMNLYAYSLITVPEELEKTEEAYAEYAKKKLEQYNGFSLDNYIIQKSSVTELDDKTINFIDTKAFGTQEFSGSELSQYFYDLIDIRYDIVETIVIKPGEVDEEPIGPVLVETVEITNTDLNVKRGETLQLNVSINPSNADNKNVIWNIENLTGEATITETGLVSGVKAGKVKVKVTSAENAEIYDEVEINILPILVETVEITNTDLNVKRGETLQLSVSINPSDADNKNVIWSIENLTGEATITETGLVTATKAGKVKVKAVTVENAEIYDEVEIRILLEEFEGGTGTKEDPYLIETVTQLDAIRNDLTACYKLINNIDLTYDTTNENGLFYNEGKGWISIGANDKVFAGTLDGDNKKIIGLNQNKINSRNTSKIEDSQGGLFANVSGEVRNLILEDINLNYISTTTSNYYNIRIGGLTSYASGTLKNIKVSGTIKYSGQASTWVGGICGYVSGGNVIDCINYSNITSEARRFIGGITGEIYKKGKIINSKNYGNIKGKESAAGIVDYISNSSKEEISVSKCTNYGKITADFPGGIVSSMAGNCSISMCANYGEILASDLGGGIAALVIRSGEDTKGYIEKSINAGEIYTYGSCGGIVGLTVFEVNDCYNIGKIYDLSTEYEENIGGIAGETRGIGDLNNTYSVGEISSGNHRSIIGNLVGNSNSNINNSYYLLNDYNGVGIQDDEYVSGTGENHSIGLELNKLMEKTYYNNFDFENVWIMNGNETYLFPELISNPIEGNFINAIEITSTNLNVKRGETLQLNISINPSDADNKNIIWSIENLTGEASITETGLVSAKKAGKVKVKAVAEDLGIIYDEVEINILPILVETVEITNTNLNVKKGETLQLNVSVNPSDADNKNVIWSIENLTGEATITETGLVTATKAGKIKVKVASVENAEIYDEVEVMIQSNYISYTSKDISIPYDGNAHSIDLKVNTENVTIKYMDENGKYTLDNKPTYDKVGEYTISYQITKDNYDTVKASNKIYIYGIKGLEETMQINRDILKVKDYNFSMQTIYKRFNIFAGTASYKHLNSNKEYITDDLIKTGDYIEILINGIKTYTYQISTSGDVNGDGKISALDYVRIKNHIMKTTLINIDVQTIAADVNDDGKISALDYVRIKNYIMNGGK